MEARVRVAEGSRGGGGDGKCRAGWWEKRREVGLERWIGERRGGIGSILGFLGCSLL